jgi:hypothetical protein
MRRRDLAAMLPLLCVTTARARTILRPMFVGEPEVLAGVQARAVFKQCSRSAPVPSRILSGPLPTEIEQLEEIVHRHISVEYEANRPSPPDATPYARQYVAYQSGAHRMIYGNYFPPSYALRRGRAVVICDGGPQFWGIALNPKTGKVESLAFNGPA